MAAWFPVGDHGGSVGLTAAAVNPRFRNSDPIAISELASRFIETFPSRPRLCFAYDRPMMRGKHIWMVPLVLALLVSGVGWWADLQLRGTIQQELRSDLQSTLEANVTALEIWMENQKRIATSLAEEPRLQSRRAEIAGSIGGDSHQPHPADRVVARVYHRRALARAGALARLRHGATGQHQSDGRFRRGRAAAAIRATRCWRNCSQSIPSSSPRTNRSSSHPFKLKPLDNMRRPGDRPGSDQRPPPGFLRRRPATNNPAGAPSADHRPRANSTGCRWRPRSMMVKA